MNHRELALALVEQRDPDFLFVMQQVGQAGLNLFSDPDAARQYLEAGAANEKPEAQYALGVLHMFGYFGRVDRELAYKLGSTAAAHGYVPAMVLVAHCLLTGWVSSPPDPKKAIELLERAAAAGYAHASSLLSTGYSAGIHVAMDKAKARRYLEEAAEAGDTSSQFLLGSELVESRDLNDQRRGIAWLHSAADSEVPSAHRWLAMLYENGCAVLEKDSEKARKHKTFANEIERRWKEIIGYGSE